MLHIHFGTGRLGLGLVVPFFQIPHSESFILNRAVSAAKPTGNTTLPPGRRNELLGRNEDRRYLVQEAAVRGARRQRVHYRGFRDYGTDDIGEFITWILSASRQRQEGSS